MELAHLPIQILVSLGLLICAVIAAVLFDLVKGKNEQLREMVIELKVRNDESTRREALLLKLPAPSSAPPVQMPAPTATQSHAQESEPVPPAREAKEAAKAHRQRTHVLSADAQAAIERGMQMAGNPKSSARPKRMTKDVPAQTAPVSPNKEKTEIGVAPPVRLRIVPADSHVEYAPSAPQNVTPVERRAPYRNMKLEAMIVQAANGAQSEVVHTQVENHGKKNWGALLSRKAVASSNSVLLDAVVAATSSPLPTPGAVPSGFHDGMVLSKLLKSQQPVSGLVVSIGVSGEVTPRVCELVKSLLGPGDFGCQAGLDEFLLIYPGERGASAQRKLSEIAQQLWNFQLRNMGELSILFSWGGVEARSESVENAIGNANERMQETRRGRGNLVILPSREPEVKFTLAKAV